MSFFTILSNILIGPLKLVFEIIYNIANSCFNNPGLSIIALSLAMNILVLPLYRRADALQNEAKDIENKLHDGIAHIKKTFSGDERMMILQTYYKQNNYSPLSSLNGSISLLLEIPFFMAAYQFLSSLEILKGVSFGPIKDLSAPDGLIVIGGLTLNLLPILMTLVNVISSALYLKGHPLKTKIQLYAMALFFLVFLYTSPSALVFYWTLNNVFSLVKTIFYKLKNPKKILTILTSIIGIAILIFAIFVYNPIGFSKPKIFLIALGVILECPLFLPLITSKLPEKKSVEGKPNKKLFIAGSLFLTVLTGLLIPSTFIAASPQEFVDLTCFNHPLWYIVSATSLAVGTFMVWLQVFYKLANNTGKTIFDKLVWMLCCLAIVNYMFFGTNLGVVSATLNYESGLFFTTAEQLINLVVLALVGLVAYLIVKKWHKVVVSLLLVAVIALGGMSTINIFDIKSSVDAISSKQSQGDVLNISLSKKGQNVVVLILDRAMGEYLPFIMEERPELKKQFAGFTYYSNAVSYAGFTNQSMPSIYGGYEYTPAELNLRPGKLVDKHNESLKVLPVLFSQNGFRVNITDSAYANYSLKPDLSIFDEYENINAYNGEGRFTPIEIKQSVIARNKRNFFCFSAMKSLPLYLQPTMYNQGMYHQVSSSENIDVYGSQVTSSLSTAFGFVPTFLDQHNFLLNMPEITEITGDETNTFTSVYNYATHEPMLLQAPDFLPTATVDNTEYDEKMGWTRTINGKTLLLENESQIKHYQINISSLLRIGTWLDYLRNNGVYDNTRIIIVSDHGRDLRQIKELEYSNNINISSYFPLFMVKDFGSTEFTTSDEFMTTADVATIATNGLVENPVNPFTQNPINSDPKKQEKHFIFRSERFDVRTNNGERFEADDWMSVEDNIWDLDEWTHYNIITDNPNDIPDYPGQIFNNKNPATQN